MSLESRLINWHHGCGDLRLMPSYTPPALNQNPRDLIIEGCRIATEENGSFQLMVNGVPVRIKPDSDPSELYSRWMSDLGRAL